MEGRSDGEEAKAVSYMMSYRWRSIPVAFFTTPPLHRSITPHGSIRLLLLLSLLGSAPARAGDFDARSASMDELMFHAQRYGNTPEKQERKQQARDELFARGTNALRTLMGQVHIDNVELQVLAQQMVESLKPEEAQPVLVEFLTVPETNTQKIAAYFLSLSDHPVRSTYVSAVEALLADDETAGAALRALGKWKVASAAPLIIPFLRHEREPRRVAAANALRDIGDPAAIPALMAALDDPYFTVREAAARALTTLGPPAETALLDEGRTAEGQRRRHIIRILGVLRSPSARSWLETLTRHSDPLVRFDAQSAFQQVP